MKKISLIIWTISIIFLAGCSQYKTVPAVPASSTPTAETTQIPTPCPGMPTVDSCPTDQEKYLVFSSSDCGEYYACRATTVTSTPTVVETPTPKTNVVTSKNITIANFKFSSASTEISVGGTISWTNNDEVAHSVVADDGSFKSTALQQWQSFSYTFTQAGTYTYHCVPHLNMKWTITVK